MSALARVRKPSALCLLALAAVLHLACGRVQPSKDGGQTDGSTTNGDATAAPVCTDAGARFANGEACGCRGDCQSGFCIDGVCCDTGCDGTCKRCDVRGSMGTCTFVPAGLSPRSASSCPTTDVKSCGTDGTCDGQGACRQYVAGTVCKAGTCDGDALSGIQTCDGQGTCSGTVVEVCAPYSCDTSKQACFGVCASNSDCALGVQCVNGSCGPKSRGTSCSKNEDCASGFCTDGVCCAVSCQGPCVSCNQTGRLGTCWPIDRGNPDPRRVCVDSGPTKCGETGACDGFGACAKYAPETVCILPSCAATRLNTAGTCDGQGGCRPSGVMDCPPYACAQGACNTSCTTDADCAPGIACVNKSCGPRRNGGACTTSSDCASGFCTDGVCCDQACAGACQSCALPSSRGTCMPTPQGTIDSRNICKDQGATSCGTNGRCDGAGGCSKYAPGTICGVETCASGIYTGAAACSITGQCVAPASRACLPFACNGSRCFDACTTSANCVAPNVCTLNSCGKKQPGAPCSAASECGSGFCAQGVCCATACNSACKSCGLAGSEGTCTNVPTGASDPTGTCMDHGAASCGTNGRCVAGTCQLYGAGTRCKNATCAAATSTFTGPSSCDGAGTCMTPAATSCFPYLCGASTCNATCTANADCAANATCINGSCGLEPKGGPCTASSQCASGLVCSAQSVCCDALCNGPCVSCTLPASPGKCSPVAAGVSDPNGKCGIMAASTCGNDGTCDAAGACHKWQAGTQCVPPSCPAGSSTQTLAKTCDGAGSCSMGGTTHACTPFMCNAGGMSSCNETCTSNADCVPPNTCVGNTCGKKPLGAACATTDQCVAGAFCTGGFCCTSSACGSCMACNATGACQPNDGAACTVADKCHVATGVCSGGACASAAVVCDDNNPCTSDACNPATGCVHTALTGPACNDGKACSASATCQAGVCTGTPKSCPGATACRAAQTCDPATGMCAGSPAPNGTACNAGNPCTVSDSCQNGTCTPGTMKTCAAIDQCHAAGTCDPASGSCSNPPMPNGSGCNAGNHCTTGDTCQMGVCTTGVAKTCGGADACHTAGTCDPASGNCSAPVPKADGTSCDSGNKCAQLGSCQGGTCMPGAPINCGASMMCDPGTGNCVPASSGSGGASGAAGSGMAGASGTGGTSGTGASAGASGG